MPKLDCHSQCTVTMELYLWQKSSMDITYFLKTPIDWENRSTHFKKKKKLAQVFQETNLTWKKALLVTQSRARVALHSKFGLNVYEMPYVGPFLDSFHDIGVLDGAQNRELDTIRYI